MMDRRAFLGSLALLAAPLAAEAQTARKPPRVGLLTGGSEPGFRSRLEAFRKGLRELGYVDGQSIVLEYRFGNGNYARLPTLAAELVRLDVNAIVANGTPASLAAKLATASIPIVIFETADPVGLTFFGGAIGLLVDAAEVAMGFRTDVGLATATGGFFGKATSGVETEAVAVSLAGLIEAGAIREVATGTGTGACFFFLAACRCAVVDFTGEARISDASETVLLCPSDDFALSIILWSFSAKLSRSRSCA